MSQARGFPLFWLPLACALIPVLAVHVAWWLSVRDGYVPYCIPYFEGCTSISRAARHGLGNHVFQFLMLPCAVLQMLFWSSARGWLRQVHHDPRAGVSMPWLGLIAGMFLILYANFLGTEGAIYQLLRRYGVIVYFAMTYLAQLALLHRLPGLSLPRAMLPLAVAICVSMLVLGLVSTWASAAIADRTLKDAVENVLEWNLGALLTAWFLLMTWLYRISGIRARLDVPRSGS
ncbi:MAG TPA: hypothetical protein PKZ76_05020 [Xanthomonadaceae bacterium]|nr:hypothetical protein [Xanthomonadaceae bacterium]